MRSRVVVRWLTVVWLARAQPRMHLCLVRMHPWAMQDASVVQRVRGGLRASSAPHLDMCSRLTAP